MLGQVQRFDPIPLVQPSGIQPYHGATGAQLPGPALLAMLKGSTASGFNPADAKRGAQRLARGRPRTVLDTLAG